jgi:hypothetical protein
MIANKPVSEMTDDEFRAYRREINRRYRERNKEQLNANRRESYKQSPTRKLVSKSWELTNQDKVKSYKRRWKDENKHKLNFYSRLRRGVKIQAIPIWSDDEFEQLVMSEIYDLAKLRSELTGIKWHVDHRVPLISEIVCGLHCSSNLQVIPAFDNLSKGNSYWEDMP